MMVVPGEVVAGRYSLTSLLARGGMADVFRAHDVVLDRRVAVKALRAGTTDPVDPVDPADPVDPVDPGDGAGETSGGRGGAGGPSGTAAAEARRFEREMWLLAQLEHPNLVRLLDAGHHGDEPFLVLELVEGPTLAQRLRHGPLGPTVAREVGRDLARALASVHDRGVVHRDVKPSNILLAPDGRALLSDFGIAQLADGTRLTATRATIGTAAYLAPEQIEGDVVTGAADVYALGLVLIEALSGQHPFEGTAYEVLVARMVRDPAIPATVPPPWARLLRAMTDRDPAARPDAAAVAAHLAAPLPGEDTGDLLPTQRLHAASLVDAASGATGAPDRRAGDTRLWPLWVAVVASLAMLAGVVSAAGRDGGSPSESAASTSTTSPTSSAPSTSTATTPTTAATTTAPSTTLETVVVAAPRPAAVAPAATCAELDAQKDAIDEERQRVDDAHRDDRETREALRDDLQEQKRALDDQKQALGC